LAREFGGGHEAVLYCAKQKLSHVQLIYDFPDRRMNFAMPVSDGYIGVLQARLTPPPGGDPPCKK
jgi:hypothetical protein